jgi:hypothetical protein
MRTLPFRPKLVAALACVALLAVAAPASARTQPITLHFSGTFDPPTVISTDPLIAFTTDHLTGDGTPLGPFTAVFPHLVNFDTATFSGVAAFTAADGDQLVVQLGGSASPTSAATYAVTYAGHVRGGTGRFDGAAGTLGGPGTVDLANLTVAATLDGTLMTH